MAHRHAKCLSIKRVMRVAREKNAIDAERRTAPKDGADIVHVAHVIQGDEQRSPKERITPQLVSLDRAPYADRQCTTVHVKTRERSERGFFRNEVRRMGMFRCGNRRRCAFGKTWGRKHAAGEIWDAQHDVDDGKRFTDEKTLCSARSAEIAVPKESIVVESRIARISDALAHATGHAWSWRFGQSGARRVRK